MSSYNNDQEVFNLEFDLLQDKQSKDERNFTVRNQPQRGILKTESSHASRRVESVNVTNSTIIESQEGSFVGYQEEQKKATQSPLGRRRTVRFQEDVEVKIIVGEKQVDLEQVSDSFLESMDMDLLIASADDLRETASQYLPPGQRARSENKGYLYYFLFTICSCLGSVFGKLVITEQQKKYPDDITITGFQTLFLRSCWAIIIICAVANKNLKKIAIDMVPRKSVGTVVFRCCQGSLSDTINYVCAAQLPLGIVGVINNMAPIVTVILAAIFLHERAGIADMIFLGLSLIGCLMLVLGAKPDDTSYKTIGEAPVMYGALFTCPIMSGAGTIALRKMRSLNTQSVAFWCNLSTLFFNLVLIMILNCVSNSKGEEKGQTWNAVAQLTPLSWTLSIVSGILSLMNFVFKFMAMQNCSATKLQKMTPLIAMYNFVFDITLFHNTFSYVQFGGMLLLFVLYVGVFSLIVYQSKKKAKEVYQRRATKYVKRVLEERRKSRLNSVRSQAMAQMMEDRDIEVEEYKQETHKSAPPTFRVHPDSVEAGEKDS